MRYWAEIRATSNLGIVNGIHAMFDDLEPEFNPASFLYIVEITGLNPQPAARWKYNIDTQEFSELDTVYLNSITSKDFYLRLTETERETFISSSDNKVRQFSYWLTLSGDVDLTDTKIITVTNYLESSGIIGSGRAAIILAIETV